MSALPADVVQRVARLPFQVGDGGASPTHRLHFTEATIREVKPLLVTDHYLGPLDAARYCFAGWSDDLLVACQVYRWPTARMLPSDGSWLELSRWCLTPDAGRNAGSRMMGWVARWLRRNTDAETLVSYHDPERHDGALYRASGWVPSPTHHSERYQRDGIGYPSGHGSWDGITTATPKHRWVYHLRAGSSDA